MGHGIEVLLGQWQQGGDQLIDEGFEFCGCFADEHAAAGHFAKLGFAEALEPCFEGVFIEFAECFVAGEGGPGLFVEVWQGVFGVFAGGFEVEESLIDLFVDVEAEVEQSEESISVGVGCAQGGVFAACDFADGLESGPFLSFGEEVFKEGGGAEFVGEVGAPPGESLFVEAFAGPCDGELEAEDMVQNGGIEAKSWRVHDPDP